MPNQFGTAYLYGIPETPPLHATIMSITYDESQEIEDVTPDQQGRRASRRTDDQTTAVEMQCRITGDYAKPALDSKVTIAGSSEEDDNGDYFVRRVRRAKQAKGHTELTLSLERWEYLNLGS